MTLRTRIREEIAETLENFRLIGRTLVELWQDLRLNIRAQYRQIKAFFARLREPLDPKRFATTPPEWYRETVKSADVPEYEEVKPREGGFAVGFDGQLMFDTPRQLERTYGHLD